MKARHIGKLRKRIAAFREFTVSTSFGIFGDFDGGICQTIETELIDALFAMIVKLKGKKAI